MVNVLGGRDTQAETVYRPGGKRRETPTSDWVPTTCRMCLVGCGVLVNVKDGKVANVIGNPNSPKNRGRMCAKGKSGIMNHYNQSRVTKPLKRTNPEKGIGIDPRWQEISWEEAIDTISKKMRKIREEDPRKLYVQTWGGNQEFTTWLGLLRPTFGTPYIQTGISPTCGKTVHSIQFITAGGFHQEPDFAHCNYLIDCGTQMGVATREGFNHQVPDCARARERGMKLVVVDPVGNNAAAKADEWLPIRPGTDAAFGLGMLNVLLNEARIYDAEFLKHHTNAGYLVGPKGKYVRDAATKKPLLYDQSDGKTKPYDDPTLKDPALEGGFHVQGQEAKPAFESIKARAADYPAERVEEITSIPAETIKRIAREFGEAAEIGATFRVDGVDVPYRPVCLDWDRGPQGHKHTWHHTWALTLVNLVLGALNVVGSLHSINTGSNALFKTWPEAGQDGMLMNAGSISRGGGHYAAFPGRPAARPERWDLFELFPVAAHTRTLVPEVHKNPGRWGIDHKVEMLIHSRGNQVVGGWGDVQAVVDWYRSIDLVVGFAVEINETHELDDIVLPSCTYLEQGSFDDSLVYPMPATAGESIGFCQIQQRVVEPPDGVRSAADVLMEIYQHVGILDEVYHVFNRVKGLKPPYVLERGERYTLDEISDMQAKSMFGEEHGWDWFREHGVLLRARDVQERYPGRFVKARVPVYLEHFIERGEELAAVLKEMGHDWDLSDYEPVPDWRPCEPFEQIQRGKIDAIGVNYKLPYTYGSQGNANPWINELCNKLPHSYGVLINARLAKLKGIMDGDPIWLESPVKKVRALARVTQCVHPEVIGIAGNAGHWAEGKPLSMGMGVNFNGLLPYGAERMDLISTALDQCAPLKVYKA
ncbi:MAG: molybdopterin-dependent oxidoreductase [Candidatus Binatia bacterium]